MVPAFRASPVWGGEGAVRDDERQEYEFFTTPGVKSGSKDTHRTQGSGFPDLGQRQLLRGLKGMGSVRMPLSQWARGGRSWAEQASCGKDRRTGGSHGGLGAGSLGAGSLGAPLLGWQRSVGGQHGGGEGEEGLPRRHVVKISRNLTG